MYKALNLKVQHIEVVIFNDNLSRSCPETSHRCAVTLQYEMPEQAEIHQSILSKQNAIVDTRTMLFMQDVLERSVFFMLSSTANMAFKIQHTSRSLLQLICRPY